MMLRVVCPQCAREIFALPQSAGKVGQCACGGKFSVPGLPARRALSTRTVTLLIAAAVGAGLAAGLLPGKRSATAPQRALAGLAEGQGPANVSGGHPAPPISALGSPAVPALRRTDEPARALASPPPSFTARDLFLLYREGPAKGDELYRGKIIRARGQLAGAPSGTDDGCVAGLVTFGTEEVPPAAYPEPVLSRAGVLLRTAPSRRTALQALESGATVEVEGRCAGWRPDPSTHFGGVVVLENCRLILASRK